MKHLVWIWALAAFGASANAPTVSLIEVKGSINPGSAGYIMDAIQRASQSQDEFLVLRLDTPGGLLTSTREIIQAISASSVPVVVYVSPSGASATSAGALIALAAHVAAMAPGTNLGAAHPVSSQGEDVKGAMGEKVTNDTAALARAQAALRGRDPAVAEQIVTKSLSFSAEEALRKKAVEIIAPDLASLFNQLEGRQVQAGNPPTTRRLRTAGLAAADLTPEPMPLKQRVLHGLADPNLSTLLLSLGGLALYAEISSGFSLLIPGAFGVFCLLLGFVSLQVIPLNLGGALLFGLGFALLAAEVFVTSYGLLTLAALACLTLGGLFLVDPAATDMRVSLSLLLPLVGSVGLISLAVAFVFWRDRRGTARGSGDQVVGGLARVESVEASGLRGTALVNGELWNFESAEPTQVGEARTVTGRRALLLLLGAKQKE